MTVNSPLDTGRASLASVTRWIGILVLLHAIWGVVRIPGKVVMRRVSDVRDYQQEGAAHYFFSNGRLDGAEAITWLRENTPEQSVVLYDGPRLGAMEFPPALLAPRLFVSIKHCDPASESFAGRPIARGEIGGLRGTVVVRGGSWQPPNRGAVTMGHLVDRAVTGLLLAFAAVTTVGVAILLVGGVVPDWLLPAALLIGLVVPRRVEFGVLTTKANRWLLVAVGLVLLVVFAALVYGALATPSRHWDGAIAWDLKAIALAEHPTLNQPLFQNPYVHHHSRDYPLFQPLLVALTERCLGFGRIVFPVCWAMALGAVGLMLRRRGASLSAVGIGMVAFACTPFLVSPTSGSVDSGYADATLAAWLTIAAAGCVLRDTRWIVCSVILVVLTKPEGLVYAGLLLGAAWLQGCRSVLRAAALGSVVGTVLLLLLQHELQFVDRAEPPLTAILIPIAVIGMMVLVDGWMDRRNLNAWRLRLAGILCIIGICVMPLLVQASGNPSGSLAHYMKDPWLVWQRLELLPAVVLSLLDCSLLHGWFGVTAPLVLLAAWQARRSKESGSSLGTWLVLCLPCWCAVFLVSNIELEHHLRSRMPRLLLHATGIAWVYILATWQARSREEHPMRGDRAGALLPR